MVKEMARFLQCKPNLDAVIEASNDRGSNYWQYVNSLFRDVQIENAMLDTGNAEGMDAAGIDLFEKAIAPTRSRHILRVETIEGPLLQQDISFSELRDQFIEKVRQGLDGNGNYGKRSYGMKSYLMPFIGVVKPLYDAKSPALQTEKKSWHEAKICGVIC